MSEKTTNTLQMNFVCQDGAKAALSVADYKQSLTDAEIKSAMAAIITANVFERGGAPFTAAQSAAKITRTVTAVDLTETV